VVHSGHLFPKASHNTTVLKYCVVTTFSQHNNLKLLCCDSLWEKGGRCVPPYYTRRGNIYLRQRATTQDRLMNYDVSFVSSDAAHSHAIQPSAFIRHHCPMKR